MRFLTLALAVMLLVVTLAVPPSVSSQASACGGSVSALDQCPAPGAGLSGSGPVERPGGFCATCMLPSDLTLPRFHPQAQVLTFAEGQAPLPSRADSPPRRPPRA
ncbi:hypothetical protein LCM17_18970 [Cereibacter sphaeroides]|nr:hypothetical protein [Cereibacter sphaeroides]